MKIGIIGGGFVGRAIARGFIEHAEVRVFDTLPERATHSRMETWQSDFVFLCLPTPAGKDGKPDCSILTTEVSGFCKMQPDWPEGQPAPAIVIRSTVRPGFTSYMQRLLVGANKPWQEPAGIVHSPEFLTARCALVDFQTPARNIIGAVPMQDFEDGDGTGGFNGRECYAASVRVAIQLEQLYERRFPGVPVQMMTSTESELTKLATNAFFAVKVDFFNLLKQICDKANADFERVRGGILSDGRIAHAHTAVPGPSGGLGFGGACLPKDLLNLLTFARKFGIEGELLAAAHEHNLMLRPEDQTLPRTK